MTNCRICDAQFDPYLQNQLKFERYMRRAAHEQNGMMFPINNQGGAYDNSIYGYNNNMQAYPVQNAQATQVAADPDGCTDGKDDGKVGFFEGVKSFFKGAAKSVVNTVKGILTDPKKALLTAGAVALSIACPPAGVAMAVAGGVMGAVKVGQGVAQASQATTDAEKKAALENCGAGTLQVGLSVVGAKAGVNAMRGTAGSAMGALSKGAGLKAGVKAFAKDTLTGGKGAMYSAKSLNGIKSAWTTVDDAGYIGTNAVAGLANKFSAARAGAGSKGLVLASDVVPKQNIFQRAGAKFRSARDSFKSGDYASRVRGGFNRAKDTFKTKWDSFKHINKDTFKHSAANVRDSLRGAGAKVGGTLKHVPSKVRGFGQYTINQARTAGYGPKHPFLSATSTVFPYIMEEPNNYYNYYQY